MVAIPQVARRRSVQITRSPAALGHAGQLAAVRHLPQADAAQAERPEHRAGPSAALAAGVTTDAELRLPVRLGDQGLLSHTVFDLSSSQLRGGTRHCPSTKGSFLTEREPECA